MGSWREISRRWLECSLGRPWCDSHDFWGGIGKPGKGERWFRGFVIACMQSEDLEKWQYGLWRFTDSRR